MRFRLRSLSGLLAVLFAMSASSPAADILISVNGTVNTADAGSGYTNGQAVTFFWQVNDFSPATPVGTAFQNINYEWSEESASDPSLWANAGGTGLGGTYQKPPDTAPYERMKTYSTGRLELKLNTDSFSVATNNHGIYLISDPNFMVKSLGFDATLTAPGFTGFDISAATLPNPALYLASYAGTYGISISNLNQMELRDAASGKLVTYTPTSVTISIVPEPSTYAFGAVASGVFAFVSRQRKKLA